MGRTKKSGLGKGLDTLIRTGVIEKEEPKVKTVEKIVEKVIELGAPLVGLSALMTTTVPAMEETIKLLKVKAPFCKIVVGGAVLTKEYADKIGADKYAKDALDTVRYAEEVTAGNV